MVSNITNNRNRHHTTIYVTVILFCIIYLLLILYYIYFFIDHCRKLWKLYTHILYLSIYNSDFDHVWFCRVSGRYPFSILRFWGVFGNLVYYIDTAYYNITIFHVGISYSLYTYNIYSLTTPILNVLKLCKF